MNVNDEIKALKCRLKELHKQAKEKLDDGIPVKDGDWSVSIDGSVGIPLKNSNEIKKAFNQFSSAESAKKHSEMMTMWRQALIDSKNRNPIDINVILPFLKKGFVAMDKSGKWCWYKYKPLCKEDRAIWLSTDPDWTEIRPFKFKPVKYWQYSLRRCGL
jgi:hypothetical protein